MIYWTINLKIKFLDIFQHCANGQYTITFNINKPNSRTRKGTNIPPTTMFRHNTLNNAIVSVYYNKSKRLILFLSLAIVQGCMPYIIAIKWAKYFWQTHPLWYLIIVSGNEWSNSISWFAFQLSKVKRCNLK